MEVMLDSIFCELRMFHQAVHPNEFTVIEDYLVQSSINSSVTTLRQSSF